MYLLILKMQYCAGERRRQSTEVLLLRFSKASSKGSTDQISSHRSRILSGKNTVCTTSTTSLERDVERGVISRTSYIQFEICLEIFWSGDPRYISELRIYFLKQPQTPTKGNPMSTDYGHATVQFPGFPAIHFSTVNQYMICPGTERPWGYTPHSFLPRRKVKAANGRVIRLSRKDRTRLRTLVKKWNKRRGYRTLNEVTSY